MTREETKNIIRAIVCAYPNYKPENLSDTVNVWAAMLKDYDYRHISIALKAFILQDTKGFAPTIGQLVEYLSDSHGMTELDAWAMVSKAVKNGLYGAQEEYEKLPEVVQKAVGSPSQLSNWAMMPPDTLHSVVYSNFCRTFRAVMERERQDASVSLLLEQAREERKQLPEDKKKRFVAIAEDV